MQNFFKFTSKNGFKKAYKTLDNIFFVEENAKCNLTHILYAVPLLSVTDAFKIGKFAILTDCKDEKEADSFMRGLFMELGASRFAGMVQEFILYVMATPKDDDDKKKDTQEAEAKANQS